MVAPFWSNTQVLWYRKSFVKKAGIDMNRPVTWAQIIKTAAENGGTVAVQANKYEGYVVWINALVSGAGGTLVKNAAKGVDATITINSPGRPRRRHGDRGPGPLQGRSGGPLGVHRGHGRHDLRRSHGAFMVNWTYIFHNYDSDAPQVAKDIGYTTYPGPCRVGRPGRRTAGSASGSASSPPTPRWPPRRCPA